MLRAEVKGEACQACQACSARRVCKTKALMQFDAGEMAVVDQSRCRGCATCLPACPHVAIIMGSTYAASLPATVS